MKINKTLENLTLEGESKKLKDNSFIITGKLTGDVEVECIKCLKKFKKEINEEVKFKIVPPPFKGFDEEYDIIEMKKFDIDEVIKSELESIKNDYNICEECEKLEFDKEF